MQFPELSASPCTRRGRASLISSSLSATMSSLALSPTIAHALGGTPHAAQMCRSASGAGLKGRKSRANAGEKGFKPKLPDDETDVERRSSPCFELRSCPNSGRPQCSAWKWSTEADTFRVTSPRGTSRSSKNAPKLDACGITRMPTNASVSISWMIASARAFLAASQVSISVRMSFVTQPTRSYMRAKS